MICGSLGFSIAPSALEQFRSQQMQMATSQTQQSAAFQNPTQPVETAATTLLDPPVRRFVTPSSSNATERTREVFRRASEQFLERKYGLPKWVVPTAVGAGVLGLAYFLFRK